MEGTASRILWSKFIKNGLYCYPIELANIFLNDYSTYPRAISSKNDGTSNFFWAIYFAI